jgi:hypothetical protein
MSLNPRLVAIQGIEFTAIQIAVQGLLDYLQSTVVQGGGYARAHVNYKPKNVPPPEPDMRHYVDRMNREFERQSRIKRDDKLAVEFIMTLLQTEILHG